MPNKLSTLLTAGALLAYASQAFAQPAPASGVECTAGPVAAAACAVIGLGGAITSNPDAKKQADDGKLGEAAETAIRDGGRHVEREIKKFGCALPPALRGRGC